MPGNDGVNGRIISVIIIVLFFMVLDISSFVRLSLFMIYEDSTILNL